MSLCLQITAGVKKKAKSVPCDIAFIFIEIPETANSILKIPLIFEIKNVARCIKTLFYWKQVCMKVRKHAETYHANKSYPLPIVYLYQFLCFQNRNLWYTFQ